MSAKFISILKSAPEMLCQRPPFRVSELNFARGEALNSVGKNNGVCQAKTNDRKRMVLSSYFTSFSGFAGNVGPDLFQSLSPYVPIFFRNLSGDPRLWWVCFFLVLDFFGAHLKPELCVISHKHFFLKTFFFGRILQSRLGWQIVGGMVNCLQI